MGITGYADLEITVVQKMNTTSVVLLGGKKANNILGCHLQIKERDSYTKLCAGQALPGI